MICRTLVANQGEVIQWPERDALEKLAEKWQQKAGMPGVVGALDGTYIPILGTSGPRRESYICRKGFPAMHLQVVCDSSLKFLYVQTGNVGSVHDSLCLQDMRSVPPFRITRRTTATSVSPSW
ncbi:hypothetical protein C0Q70_19124 [Pomacea canaliculata]|uniref:DDE Tnp4 domain-containing protein n=2 Tax=Pomacea canaliculata TaxID=400727 RepID=A0A2T7NIF9_POMCA|nr:hypothetical protein C0Q70_19124 [Pomacea canaliculata]